MRDRRGAWIGRGAWPAGAPGRGGLALLVGLFILGTAVVTGAPAGATQAGDTQSGSSLPVNPHTHLPPGVLPKTPSGPQALAAPAGAHLTYYGGRVISNVQVVQVLYGAGIYTPEVQNTASPSIATFYQGVTNSPYYDWLTEYNTPAVGGTNQTIGRGAFVAQYAIAPSAANSGSTVDDVQIQAELHAQIAAGHLPPADGNTYYALYFPKNVTITMGGLSSGVQFCAYHGTIAPNGSVPEVYYGVLPDFTTGGMTFGCGASTTFGNETSVSSHELVEATTDPEVGLATVFAPPLAWYDAVNGEIGDICNAQQGSIVGGDGVTYVVQKEFSNVANDCIVSRSVTSDFSVSASPASLTVARGASGTSTISTTAINAPETVSLAASGLPSGVTASFNPASVNSGGSSTLTLTASSSATAGPSTVTVTGTAASGGPHTTTVSLTVTTPPSDFSVSASPASLTVARGASGTSTISTTAINAPETVSLAASGLPSGVTASFNPASVNSGGSSTLTLTASSSATAGPSTVTVTATAASGGPHTTTVSLTITAPGPGCPCSLWNAAVTPAVTSSGDVSAVELGVKFTSSVAGFVTGVRFYKGAGNGGTHVGSLWTAAGSLLATATFSGESASGWQTVTFSSPVSVSAGTTYVASYFAPQGNYAFTANYFASAFVNAPLTAPATGTTPNGVFRYGASSGFPTGSFNAANYWVDPIFDTASGSTPQTITFGGLANEAYGDAPVTVSATGGGSSNPVTFTVTSPAGVCTSGGVNGSTITIVGAGSCTVQANQAGDATYAPAAPVSQSFTVAKAPLTVTADAKSKAYGAANPVFTSTPSGFVNGETASVLTTPATCSSTAVASSGVAGSPYTITCSGAVAANYTINYVAGQLTVTQAPLTVTADAKSKVAGSANPALTATLSGFVLSQTLATSGVSGAASCSTTATAASPAGSYPITCVVGSLAAANYSFGPFVAGTLTVTGASGCPCSLWNAAVTPAITSSGDASAVELGVKFTSSVAGFVTGVRFYKGAGNGGTHVGHLWTTGGSLLATATFSGESASGWQTVTFSSPVSVSAGTTYVASYFAPQGNYAFTANYFASAFVNAPLTAPATGTTPNGVFRYGASSGFPTGTFNAANYWVDPIFDTGP